jgi:hypothetical protein
MARSLEDLVALYLLEHQEEEVELHEHVELDNAPGRHKPRQRRLCWLTLRDCLSFKVFFLQYTT